MHNNEITTIKAIKNLYNNGKCFTKGRTYTVKAAVPTEANLMDRQTTNDQGEPHYIGSWWRSFKIVR